MTLSHHKRALIVGSLVALANCSPPMKTPADVPNPTDVPTEPFDSSVILDVPTVPDVPDDVPTAIDVPSATDAGTDVRAMPEAGADRTLTFVISAMTVDPAPANPTAPLAGFNIDGIFSNEDGSTNFSCSQPDQTSTLDADQNAPVASLGQNGRAPANNPGCMPDVGCRGGVDNMFPNLVEGIEAAVGGQFPDGLRAALSGQIRTNTVSLVLRITGVNDLTNDDSVQVKVYSAYPTFVANCNAVVADRQYAIASSSVIGGNIEMPSVPPLGARIVAGRLMVTMPGQFPFPILPGGLGPAISVRLSNAQLRFDITEAAGTRGNLGGLVSGAILTDMVVAQVPGAPRAAVEAIVGSVIDIEEPVPTPATVMNGVCVNRMVQPTRFGNIGIGVGFETVRATLAAAPVAARPMGACGSGG